MSAGKGDAKQRQALERFYADFTEWLLSKFYQWDPQQIAFGPSDEYKPEVRQILPLLRETRSVEELTQRIPAVFVRMFSAEIAGTQDTYRPFAREIIDEWQKRWKAVWVD